jgi:hypothetical protein
MAAFTSDVMASTAEKDPQEYSAIRRMMQQATEAANKQYGGVGTRLSTAKPSASADIAAENKYDAGEYDRRKQATTGAYDLSKSIDERTGDFAEKVRSALYDRSKLKTDIPEKQRQLEVGANLKQRETQQQGKEALNKIEFSSFQNAADRIDSMNDAYNKGILEMDLLAIAQQGQLDTADLDRYFTLLKTDLNNQLQDITAIGGLERDMILKEIEAKGNNLSSFISGLFGIGSAAAGYLS